MRRGRKQMRKKSTRTSDEWEYNGDMMPNVFRGAVKFRDESMLENNNDKWWNWEKKKQKQKQALRKNNWDESKTDKKRDMWEKWTSSNAFDDNDDGTDVGDFIRS